MYQKKNYRTEDLHKIKISNLDLEIENYWSPYVEKELLEEVKSSKKHQKNLHQSELKSLCLLVLVLGLLSIGIGIQADCIAQNVRKIVRNSIQQIIQINQR